MSARTAAADRDTAPAAALLARIARAMRIVLGAPDYGAYRERLARDAEGRVTLPEREFVQRKLEERYARPGSRCC